MSVIDLSLKTQERKPGPFEPGRRCTYVDEHGVRCITVLNRHHIGPNCYCHEAEEIQLPFMAALAELERVA